MPAVLLLALIGGCTSEPTSAPATPSPTGASASAVMVCSPEAQEDIQATLGVALSKPPVATFVDGLYTCTYPYANGKMIMTVKDLPDAAATAAYTAQLRGQLTKVHDLPGLGDAAFSDDVSTVVVSKDFKVLRVDTSGIPDGFGQPPHARYTVAVAVAAAIMLCWTGA
jgi:hypothetical protein